MTDIIAEIDDTDPPEHVSVKFLQVFDHLGQIRTDISAEEIAGLSPALQAEWAKLSEVSAQLNAAEEALTSNTKEIHRLANAEVVAFEEVRQLEPPVSPVAAMRAAAETFRTGKSVKPKQSDVPPHLRAKFRAAKSKLDEITADLTRRRSAHYSLKRDCDLARGKMASAMHSWAAAAEPKKKTHRELMEEVNRSNPNREALMKKQNAEALANASPLDAILRGNGGKRGRALTLARRSR